MRNGPLSNNKSSFSRQETKCSPFSLDFVISIVYVGLVKISRLLSAGKINGYLDDLFYETVE